MVLKQFTPDASVFMLEFGNAHLQRLLLVCSHPWYAGCPGTLVVQISVMVTVDAIYSFSLVPSQLIAS